MTKFLESVHAFVWGAPVLVLILGVGCYLSFRTGFAQLTLFPRAVKLFFGKLLDRKGMSTGVSSFQALCTALAATVGTGNLVGVAGAICLGGPGAVFWMWICGILAMVTKFAEVTLAVRFRVREGDEYLGGPMYILSQAMGRRWKWLAVTYCCFGVLASFGVGNATQINSVITGINNVLQQWGVTESPVRNLSMGAVLALLVGAMLLGGVKRIGKAAEMLVPFVSAAYILLCIWVLIAKWEFIPMAISSILQGAFCPKAVTGGLLGSAFQALKVGCSRGVFTNEAGMGTASIAHASAEVRHPVEQGMMGITEVFLDTIVICTLTALVILVSGIPVPFGQDAGGALTALAFSAVLGNWTSVFLAGALCCFAFATVLGWGLYGARCSQFLFGKRAWNAFAAAQTIVVMLSAVMKTETIWLLAEILNGLMAIPNLIILAVLAPEVVRLIQEYRKTGALTAGGGNYADFHQRKPLRTFSHEKVPSSGDGSQKRRQEDLSSEYRSAGSSHP